MAALVPTTVRDIVIDALSEIGAYSPGESLSAADAAIGLRRFQSQLDSWAAERLTLSRQSRLAVTWPTSTSTQTIGPSGGDITAARPVWINELTYVVAGSSPAVEVPLGPMDQDSYANQSIKGLTSAYPLNYFYQTQPTSVLGELFLWPQPSQQLTLYLYAPVAIDVPITLEDTLYGPPGYQDAFMYQLALRLCTPFGAEVPPLLPKLAQEAWARMQRPNVDPGLVGVDTALVPTAGGFNVLTGTFSSSGRR